MGLVKEGDDYVILTDIQGAEDHLGDMDFKVAGTREGITALQMDIKITGVTQEIMRSALEQAKRARVAIMDAMLEAIPEAVREVRALTHDVMAFALELDAPRDFDAGQFLLLAAKQLHNPVAAYDLLYHLGYIDHGILNE